MKRKRRSAVLITFVTTALLISPFVVHRILNNWKLSKLENSFSRIKHPAQTTFIKRASDVGLLIGNSDHCDFFVGELRSCSGTQQQITDFYKTATVWSPIENTHLPLIEVVFLKQGVIPAGAREYLPISYQTNESWSLQPHRKSTQLQYIVYVLDVGTLNEGCDVRCL